MHRRIPSFRFARSDVEEEVHDVAVLHDVLLALDADLAHVAARLFGAQRHVVVVLDDLGADEAAFEVGVDYTGTLRSLPALVMPAVCGAFIPLRNVHARVSSAPVVKNV